MKIQDLQGRFFLPGLISEVPAGNLLWVDAVNGNDVLAVRGRMTVPFKTLTAAKNAAQSGDTIVVLPGTYNEADLLKNGVNWHFLNGARIQYTGGGSYAIFDTHGVAVQSCITGYGDFTNASSSGCMQVVYAATAQAQLHVAARNVESSTGNCIKAIMSSGSLEVSVLQSIVALTEGVWITAGSTPVIIRANLLYSSTAPALRIDGGSADVYAHRIVGSTIDSQAGAINITGGNALTSIHAFEILCSARVAVRFGASYGAAKVHIHGARIISNGTGANGRSVEISEAASDSVRLSGCVLIAGGDYSLYSTASGTRVHVLNGLAVNKNAGNVTPIGGEIYAASSYIT